MQAAGIASSLGGEMAEHIPGQIKGAIQKIDPVLAAHAMLREAQHNPEIMRGLLAPVTGPSGNKWAKGIEPWVKATGVQIPQPWLNPNLEGPTGPEDNGDDTAPSQ